MTIKICGAPYIETNDHREISSPSISFLPVATNAGAFEAPIEQLSSITYAWKTVQFLGADDECETQITMFASEETLGKIWNDPAEDEAWQDL
ncbi:MAG: hypothetical protein P4L33_05040 [Capsulimonadaceae bacterium]|nr:hypothetical protein [Capsulimonadaceae bacterium]